MTLQKENDVTPLNSPSSLKLEASESTENYLFTRTTEIHSNITATLVGENLPLDKVESGEIRRQTILYLIYWHNRLRNNLDEQARIFKHLKEYIGDAVVDPEDLTYKLVSSSQLAEMANEYVEKLLVPIRTVDLVVVKGEDNDSKEVLLGERSYYPFGISLPSGIIQDQDESNPIGLPADTFAALRVAATKILQIDSQDINYSIETDTDGTKVYVVRGKEETPKVKLYPVDESGYKYRENIKTVLRPADPRHIVNTIAFKCELIGEPKGNFKWVKKSQIMSTNTENNSFAFGHHREMVAHISAQTSVEKERNLREREFIRSIIRNPRDEYNKLKHRFDCENGSPEVSVPELFPVVDKMLTKIFSTEINEICEQIPIVTGIRDKLAISLRHVSLKNRKFCPYLPTLHAIFEGIAFFDLIARHKKGFYENMPKDKIVEHNPAHTKYASYHMYRYKYRMNQLLNMVPDEIVIPTTEYLSATDLLKTRCVPVRFVGLSEDFLYVDEFEQSPEEFLMHDCNHSWRMAMEDLAYMKENNMTRAELTEQSYKFSKEYLEKIRILETDTEEQREIKKIKKIILFEIVHEDARPFMRDVICKYIQAKEGGSVPFEVPRIDRKTGYMDMVDTLDTGISTLSYVRNKLQHGFYDHIDAQLPQIVDPKYRNAKWIAQAAHEMLLELGATPSESAELDESGNVSMRWLLQRTCAVGPDNIHETDQEDPLLEEFGDGAEALNPKRYQAPN